MKVKGYEIFEKGQHSDRRNKHVIQVSRRSAQHHFSHGQRILHRLQNGVDDLRDMAFAPSNSGIVARRALTIICLNAKRNVHLALTANSK